MASWMPSVERPGIGVGCRGASRFPHRLLSAQAAPQGARVI